MDMLTHFLVISLFTILVWISRRQRAQHKEHMRLHYQADLEILAARRLAEDAAAESAACIAVVDKLCNKRMSRRYSA